MVSQKVIAGTAAVLLVTIAVWIGVSFAAESQPAATAHVALLEAEYITPDTTAARRELTGWLDTVLTDSLARQKDLALVDRQALDKVLAERNLAKLDARTGDAGLRPFIASGVLICPTIVADAKAGKAVVTVQAVLAQRGALLSDWNRARVWCLMPISKAGEEPCANICW